MGVEVEVVDGLGHVGVGLAALLATLVDLPGGQFETPATDHGGSLGEGATQGSGQIREAVQQLRGSAGGRQVPDARTALSAMGGLFYNAQAVVLHVE